MILYRYEAYRNGRFIGAVYAINDSAAHYKANARYGAGITLRW